MSLGNIQLKDRVRSTEGNTIFEVSTISGDLDIFVITSDGEQVLIAWIGGGGKIHMPSLEDEAIDDLEGLGFQIEDERIVVD
jgi:hypothetical protein